MTTQKLAPQVAPADDQVLKDVAAQIAAGTDPFGDDDDDSDDGTTAPAGEGEGNEEGEDAAGDGVETLTPEEQAAADALAAGDAGNEGEGQPGEGDPSIDALESLVNDDPAPAPLPTYQVPDIDFGAERKALTVAQKAIEKKWTDGEIDDDARIDQLAELSDKRDALVRAETIAQINADGAIQSDQRVLNNLAVASAKAGEIDYNTDATAATAFNALLPAIQSDPANKGKSYAVIASLTHDALCAARGVKRKAAVAAPVPAPAQPRKAAPTPPVTLRGIPNAATANTGGDWKDELGRLSGQEWEEAYNKLPQSRKDELLA